MLSARRTASLLLAWLLTSALPLCAQKAVLIDGKPALKFKDSDDTAIVVVYAEGADSARFRVSVMHDHFGYCKGNFEIGRDHVAYDAADTPEYSQDAFNLPRNQVSVTTDSGWIRVQTSYRLFNFTLVWQPDQTPDAAMAGPYNAAFGLISRIVNDFQAGEREFLQATAEVRKPPPSATPPVLSIFEPSGAAADKTLLAAGRTIRVHGMATHASGIGSVLVNGKAAFLKTLSSQVVEFDLRDFELSPGVNPVVIAAVSSDKAEAQLAFRIALAEVRILEPAAGKETPEAAIKVRGVATGFGPVEGVEIAGVAAELHPRADGAVEFEAAAVPLAVGANRLAGQIRAAGGLRQPFEVEVKRSAEPATKPLTIVEVEEALRSGVPPARLRSLVSRYGVNFALDDAIEERLRREGADDALLLAIARNRK